MKYKTNTITPSLSRLKQVCTTNTTMTDSEFMTVLSDVVNNTGNTCIVTKNAVLSFTRKSSFFADVLSCKIMVE